MRLKWLRLDTTDSAQPYLQLASFYSELGERAIARRVLYTLEDRQYGAAPAYSASFLSGRSDMDIDSEELVGASASFGHSDLS